MTTSPTPSRAPPTSSTASQVPPPLLRFHQLPQLLRAHRGDPHAAGEVCAPPEHPPAAEFPLLPSDRRRVAGGTGAVRGEPARPPGAGNLHGTAPRDDSENGAHLIFPEDAARRRPLHVPPLPRLMLISIHSHITIDITITNDIRHHYHFTNKHTKHIIITVKLIRPPNSTGSHCWRAPPSTWCRSLSIFALSLPPASSECVPARWRPGRARSRPGT